MIVATRLDRNALIAAAALLGAALAEALWPHALDGPQVTPGREDAAAAVASSTAPYPEHSALAVMAQRPLFTVDRRPYQPPPSAQNTAPTGPPPPTIDAQLVGIAKAADAQLILLRVGGAPTVHRLRMGEQIEGWSVTSIGGATATLSNNGHERELSLVTSAGR